MNIVIFSTQYNRYGGAATCAYELHKYFIKNNINSISIFFDNSILGDEKKYNHDKLPNVFACKLLNDYLKQDINLKIYDEIKKIVIEKTNGNFIMLGFNYLAPLIGKLLFPNNLMYYMITGTCYINNLNITNGTDLIVNKFSQEFNLIEKKTIEVSDYIIPNSNIMKNLITNIYGIIPDEIYDLHEIYEDNDQVYFNNKNDIGNFLINSNSLLQYDYIKKYDIIFISSNFDRKVKNIDLVKQIYMSEKMENLNKIVIGKNSSNYFNTNEIKNLTVYDFMNQEEIIYLIRKSKIILIPSFIESYSITCIEATNNLCIPLLSPNVGCNNFINQYYIVNDYSVEKWIEKINQINKNYIYHTKIFYNMYSHGNKILELCTKCPINFEKKKVLFITVDIPGVGGSATNTLNLINNLKDIWDIYSIFIDSNTNTIINGLENYIIINNDNNIINNLNEYKKNLTFEFNFIFCKSGAKIGTDSRRIIQENRTDPVLIHFKSENNYLKEINSIISQIEENYKTVKTMIPKPIIVGGGIHGEAIGVHIHFNLCFKMNFLILMNKLIGGPIQDMLGGKRPEFINPSDTFTLDISHRSPNHYGIISNDEIKIGGHEQIRTKNYDNGEQGFEYRNPPNFFLNKSFTYNTLATIIKILELDYKGFDFPIDKRTIITKEVWQNIFENFIPAWEFWYQKNQLNLQDNPYKYFLEINKEILNKVSICSTHFKANEQAFNSYLKNVYQYIPNINSTINIKVESGNQNRVIVPAIKKKEIEHLLELYRLQNIKVLNSAFDFPNNYYLQFSFLKDMEIKNVLKSFLLTATNK